MPLDGGGSQRPEDVGTCNDRRDVQQDPHQGCAREREDEQRREQESQPWRSKEWELAVGILASEYHLGAGVETTEVYRRPVEGRANHEADNSEDQG